MIEPYEFIDKNADGDKERLTGATVQLYNKLSADETNLFRDKINEIITFVNTLSGPTSKNILEFELTSNPMDYEMDAGQIVYLVVVNEIVYKNWVQTGTTLTIADYPLTGGGFTDLVTVYYEQPA